MLNNPLVYVKVHAELIDLDLLANQVMGQAFMEADKPSAYAKRGVKQFDLVARQALFSC